MNRATDKITFDGRNVEVTEAIADIIKKENFDAIAIQEIEGDNIGAIERVIQYLNKEKQIYRTTYPAKMGRSDSKAEFLPIIYNSEKLKLKSSGMLKDLWMQRSPHYAQIIDIVKDYCSGDGDLGKKISDHLPVFAVFKTSRDSE